MRISSSSIPVSAIASDKPAQPPVAAAPGGKPRGDIVQLSTAGAAAASSSSTSDHAARIATLKASIENGSYQVDIGKLADRIVEEDHT